MPYNVVIADDEYFIRQRLKKIISWDDLNLTFVGEAENGYELIELISQKQVDIVLLDIKMPQMTGMEAAKIISQDNPLIKIVILSGFDDFNYARSAMRYGVVDYLLKPVDPEELKKVLIRCKDSIIKEQEQDNKDRRLLRYDRNLSLSAVLNSNMKPEDLINKYPELKHALYTQFIGCFIYSESDEKIQDITIWLKSKGFECEYYKELDYSYVIQLFLSDKAKIKEAKSCLEIYVKNNPSDFIFMTFSEIIDIFSAWFPSYKQVEKFLNYRYFSNQETAISGDFICNNICKKSRDTFSFKDKNKEKNEIPDISKIRQGILLYLNARDSEGFTKMVSYWFDQIQLRADIDFFFTIVSEFYLTYSIYYRDMINIEDNIADYVSVIISEDYELENIKEVLISAGLSCIKHSSNTPSDIVLSRKIAAYIDDNYTNTDLTVAQIADKFQLNPSYMGSIFKKVYNQSLLQYITHVRMEASIRLMADRRYKMSDIAEMVGYTDAFYYSKRFKQIYGVSPKSYSLSL